MLFRLLLALSLAAAPTLAWGQMFGIYGYQRPPPGAPPSLVRKKTATDVSGTTISNLSASSVQVSAGDLLAVVCRVAVPSGSLPTISVTDTAGDTFTAATSSVSYDSVNAIQLFYAKNAIGQSSSASVTCHFSVNTWYDVVAVLEYSGASTSSPLDAHAIAGGALSGGSITTSNFNGLPYTTTRQGSTNGDFIGVTGGNGAGSTAALASGYSSGLYGGPGGGGGGSNGAGISGGSGGISSAVTSAPAGGTSVTNAGATAGASGANPTNIAIGSAVG